MSTNAPRRLGNYELGPRLGAGGMGEVYRARHVHLGKIRAVKLLPDDHLNKPHRVARFIREMQAIGKLEHPNIVQAFDAEVEGTPFLAMEYIEGIDVAMLVEQRGHLAVADACELVKQAAAGLQCAHEAGLVHRDIKPSNLMLTREGVVKMLDLGLALLQVDDQPDNSLSRAHPVGGTPEYMAPEQFEASHKVDIRADLYSLGCTLYHLLAGKPPFHDCQSKIQAHMLMAPPPLGKHRADLPAGLVAVVERLLAKEPAARHATPAELRDALRPFVAGSNLRWLAAAKGTGKPPAAETDAPGPRSTHTSVPPPRVPASVPKVDSNDVEIRLPRATTHTRKRVVPSPPLDTEPGTLGHDSLPQSRRHFLIGGIVGAILCLVVGGLYWLRLPGLYITRANYDRIQPGMSEAEVTGILGRGEELDSSGINMPGQSFTLPGAGSISVPGMSASAKVLKWERGQRSITIGFMNGRVVVKNQMGL